MIKIKRKQVSYEKTPQEVRDQYVSQIEDYDTQFESELRHGKESVTASNFNFDKIQKVDNKVEVGPLLHGKITDTMKTNFNSRIP